MDPPCTPKRLFRFTKENIAKLKSKANLEVDTNNISSFQAHSHLALYSTFQKLIRPLEDEYFRNSSCDRLCGYHESW